MMPVAAPMWDPTAWVIGATADPTRQSLALIAKDEMTHKRRTITVRLLLCLAPITLFLIVAAPAEADAPLTPKLNGTSPTSSAERSALSTTPLVFGEAEPPEGITIASAPWDPRPLVAVARLESRATGHPEYGIQIFFGANCAGSPIATGTAGELEGTGIPVTVPADAKTTLSAKQVDLADEVSDCSNPLSYWEGDVPPEEPSGGQGGGGGAGGGNSGSSGGGSSSSGSVGPATPAKPQAPHIHTNPGGFSNDSTPVVLGTAQGADSVLVYTSDNCSGAAVAKGPASQLSAGFEVSVAPNATTTFSAAAITGQRSACSESVTYTEDSTAPKTRITMAPGVKTRKHKAVFRFKDITEDPPGTTFACKVDKKKWKPCASPLHLKHLKYGHHLVKIRATDLAGNVEHKPVKRRFIVVHAGRR